MYPVNDVIHSPIETIFRVFRNRAIECAKSNKSRCLKLYGNQTSGNWTRFSLTSAILSTLLVTEITGCGGGSGTSLGQIVVDWTISTSCSVAGVIEVETRLVTLSDGATGQVYDLDRRACSSADPVIFVNVEPGTYRVEVEGFDSASKGTYFGAIETVNLGKGRTLETPVVKLTQKKTAIDVQWVFSNGKLCSHNGVSEVQLAVFDAETSAQYFESELAMPFACDPFSMPVALRTVGESPDLTYVPGGVLLGGLNPAQYLVYAFGLDPNGDKIVKGMVSSKTVLGQVTESTIVLVPCQSGDYPTLTCD
ncbi:MAG: hypothetical protein HUU55_23855 [Myxococcales bacterium]|nr:hypothetical protein [Myxococcales bacterium]